jgi:hypothetical protein
MHLNEFTDPRIYALPADDMAAVLNQLERVWCDDWQEDSPLINHLTKKPDDRRRKLMDEWRRDGTKQQLRRRHLSPLRSQ